MELKIIAATIFEQESMKTCKTVHPRSFYPRRATGRPDSAETRTRFAPCDSIPRIQTIPTGSAVLRKHHKHGSRKKTLTTAKTFTGISFLNWLRFSMNPQHRIRIQNRALFGFLKIKIPSFKRKNFFPGLFDNFRCEDLRGLFRFSAPSITGGDNLLSGSRGMEG